MKHYGDITKISGYAVEPVDVITGGSPCQDLSVAGKRAGMSKACPVCGYKAVGNTEEVVCPHCGAELGYTRSGLFMEQIRIIKEMRQNDRDHGRTGMLVRPRYCIWENVPGSFSSNGGKDFQAVLTEFVKVCDPSAPDVPMPEKGGWPHAGILYDEMGGWSVAWRQHDAQYWGVPQRRKRICVLADFNGLTAGEILFDAQLRGEAAYSESDETLRDPGGERRSEVSVEREGLPGHPQPQREAGQGAAAGAGSGALPTGGSSLSLAKNLHGDLTPSGAEKGEASGTAGSGADGAGYGIDQQGGKGGAAFTVGVSPTLAGDSHGTPHAVSFQERSGKPGGARESSSSGSGQEPCQPSTIKPCAAAGFKHKASPAAGGVGYEEEKAPSLMAGQESAVCYKISSFDSNAMKSPNPHSGIYKADTARTLDLNGGSPACNQGGGGRDRRGLPERHGKPGRERDITGEGAGRTKP